jgi:hypothetical protein
MDKNKDAFFWFEYAENDLEAVTILSEQLNPKLDKPEPIKKWNADYTD